MSDLSPPDLRRANGRFAKGNPGGPGRPRNPVSAIAGELDRLGVEAAPELVRDTVAKARKGDPKATELVLRRVWPTRRHRPIELDPGPGDGLRNLLAEHAALAEMMMNGDVTPQEAQAATRVFKALQEQIRRADDQKMAERFRALRSSDAD
jgi:hypothetical protein